MLLISWKTAKQCVDSRQALLLANCPCVLLLDKQQVVRGMRLRSVTLSLIVGTGSDSCDGKYLNCLIVFHFFQIPKHANFKYLKLPETMNVYTLIPTTRSSWRPPILSRRRRRRGSQLPGRRTRWSCKSMRTKWGELFSMLSPKKIRRGYRKTPGNVSEGKNERSWNLIIEFFRSQDGLSL